ncbi:alpha/beta hydrolase [Sediminibacillus massiliensis]|uniref:alpha/beta hydrolase n=1 Tax=Sediminibacillus massiliensis TaxID=1926277 RepID=UPI0009888606|nr:alpha/beta hydrolase [Sediminibacillus massiliensis]
MKKKIYISISAITLAVLIVLVAGANYFYGESVKRGKVVELHKEADTVEVFANSQEQKILEQAKIWFNRQAMEVIEKESFDGLKLTADFLGNDQNTGKAVILAHGYRGQSDQMGDYAQFYYDQGFDVLLPDSRGHGDSEGDYIGYGWHDRLDYLSWIEELVENHQADKIILHGNSMGAALVLMASGEELPEEVKGIIADSGYTSVKEELSYQLKHLYHLPSFPIMDITSAITRLRAGFTFGEASAVKQVADNTKPLLIIHGDKDELVPTEMAYELFDAAGGDKELWIVPDAGHTKAYSVATLEFQNRVQDFIERSMNK